MSADMNILKTLSELVQTSVDNHSTGNALGLLLCGILTANKLGEQAEERCESTEDIAKVKRALVGEYLTILDRSFAIKLSQARNDLAQVGITQEYIKQTLLELKTSFGVRNAPTH